MKKGREMQIKYKNPMNVTAITQEISQNLVTE